MLKVATIQTQGDLYRRWIQSLSEADYQRWNRAMINRLHRNGEPALARRFRTWLVL